MFLMFSVMMTERETKPVTGSCGDRR